MKVAITGKGGVGKTTFASTLARLYAAEGRQVLAVDVDPDSNLGLSLGFTDEELNTITPISQMKKLIEERAVTDAANKVFKLNPEVSDIPDTYAKEKNGVRLLVMGTVETAGAGCVCPEHVMLKAVLSNLVLRRDDVVIMDMEAGLEHLGRGTASMMDMFIVVVEPGARSVQTYENVCRLAHDIGVNTVMVVGNKIKGEEDKQFIESKIDPKNILGYITYTRDVIDADRSGASPYDYSAGAVEEIRNIKARMDNNV